MSDTTPPLPPGPDAPLTSPAIGQDEWVARHLDQRATPERRLGTIEARLRNVPWWAWLALFTAAISTMPLVSSSGYVRRVGFDTVIYMLLALGLNVVVGWGGLLDLGYVAFYGVGAYAYVMLDSDKFGVHLPTIVSIPSIVIIGALVGFLVGLPSRRLAGDYLAIVTLFFLQIFLTVTTNGDQIFGHNITGGANGIGSAGLHVDPLSFFGHQLAIEHQGVFAVSYYYVAIGLFAVVFVALRFVNHSRTGRAWRSLREDPLAAEVMGMPVNWLKLMSFAFGAAVAALTGTLFAALSASVFPLTFSFPLLIIVYTTVILGGQGSQQGVVLGALIIGPLLALLQEPPKARFLFYVFAALGIVLILRVSRKLAAVSAATLGLGFAIHAIANAIDHAWVAGGGSGAAHVFSDWVVVPQHLASWIQPVSYVGLIGSILALTLLGGWRRLVLLVPTLYLGAFVWENVLLAKPEPTRFIVLGVILVALMILRPNGLLGEKRVEIV
jgi:branched-chain amino acid transport system permease protein